MDTTYTMSKSIWTPDLTFAPFVRLLNTTPQISSHFTVITTSKHIYEGFPLGFGHESCSVTSDPKAMGKDLVYSQHSSLSKGCSVGGADGTLELFNSRLGLVNVPCLYEAHFLHRGIDMLEHLGFVDPVKEDVSATAFKDVLYSRVCPTL